MKAEPHAREDYCWFMEIPTRWADNDVYGHVNNAAYYGFFDTAVNGFLIKNAGLDIEKSRQIGLVVETRCSYFAPLAYPEVLDIGVRADRIGNSSVHYGLAVFGKGAGIASAQGAFVHVYVDRQSRRPMPLNKDLRQAAMAIRGGESA